MKATERKYTATCPICEKKLFRGCVADIEEFFCPKCKAKLAVVIEQGSVQIREADFQYEAKSSHM